MKPSAWHYDWIHVNEVISMYYRIRQEEMSDGMSQPFIENLAYMQKVIIKDKNYKWRALLHSEDDLKEMSIPHSNYPMQVMNHIQQYFIEI